MGVRRKFWGWGLESDVLSPEEVGLLERSYAKQFGVQTFEVVATPRIEDIALRPSRIAVPGTLSEICSTDHYERLLHSYGRSFFDSARIFQRDFSNPPDVVAFPRNETELISVLDWCDGIDAKVIPWGGGSSVAAGVEPPRTDHPVITLDMQHFDRILEVDVRSQAARIQGGYLRPRIGIAIEE